MTNRKRVFWATTALFSGLMVASAASAQSTGSETTEATALGEVVVTGARGQRNIDGLAVAETVAKTRNTITQEFIATQTPGQTILQTLNLTPGLSFTNTDSYGTSGGNIRLRGFDGNRVSLTFDGIPLNDTGNYATYTNQQLDPELIERASVNTGSTDVDSPTAAATGGVINYVTRRPAADFGGWGQFSFGDFDYRRYMFLMDTGEFGPWGTSAWFSVSRTDYDKFKGRGDLQKRQFNGRIYQPLGDNGDFLSLSGNWNENRNNNYLGPNLGTATGSILPQVETDPRGWDVDFLTDYVAPTFRNGVADNDTNSTNYWGLRVNPSNTGNIRGQSRFTLSDSLVLTVDPSFQYVLANGGTQQTVLSETDRLIRGTSATGGLDLNGDGDTLDRVRVMTPSNTNTHRYGLNTSLIWDMDDNHRLRAAYALDFGRHRQTGQYGRVNFSNPSDPRFVDWFGGRNDEANRVVNLNGYELRSRDRLSIAELNQFSLEYRGQFMDDALTVSLGVRAPFFRRELNQFCFTQNSSSNVRCTTETPTVVAGTGGNVVFAGSTTQYIAPYSREVEYDDILPNVGASYRWGEGHSVYANYAETLSAPRTDSLYGVRRFTDGTIGNPTVQPESARNFDLGYRYTAPTLVGTVSVFANNEENRIVSSFDDDLGQFVDRNVGAVERIGAEGSIGWSPIEALSLYASATWLQSEVQDDYVNNTVGGVPQIVRTKGKELVETPDLMLAARMNYQFTDYLEAGIQAKYTGERWVTDVNDMKADAFTTVDANIRLDLAQFGYDGTFIQVNADNIFDEQYYANLGTRASSTPGTPGFSQPFASVGAPRTISATLRVAF
ncbi:MAG: TonB-dependent receptor [Alphaproteobacteria bacterium]|jgi:iron complex outermembrane recepter protein|nr:TonB-dependent receptor [Alphaproteobacteria bacterium]MBU2041237.1 TonB-dependent receptor [Alphaproteobacteria bacterium]MBU2124948.1 TonB-dependent receptor [Alphaproteobacteria bacterium]MBU2207642.1 TonB-dependent receptor [Alphaproteobacteria bacterium]MBU2290562.1 TonB-dependent receptor [Alphaproteobacteria bacterium]